MITVSIETYAGRNFDLQNCKNEFLLRFFPKLIFTTKHQLSTFCYICSSCKLKLTAWQRWKSTNTKREKGSAFNMHHGRNNAARWWIWKCQTASRSLCCCMMRYSKNDSLCLPTGEPSTHFAIIITKSPHSLTQTSCCLLMNRYVNLFEVMPNG